MKSYLSTLDASILIRKPVLISDARIASVFLGTGMLLILMEALFFDYFAGLANSSFTTRRIIGFHLFPSEIWFIFLGNTLLFLVLGSRGFMIPRHPVNECRPVFLVLGVYSIWFVYGSLADNDWALQEFREMVFTAFSLPPILYFASHLRPGQLLQKFIVPGALLLLALSPFGVHNAALVLGSFFASYFAIKLLYKSNWAIIGLGLVSLSFLFKFAKPMIVLLAFCAAMSFVLAGYLNQQSVNWVLSKFKIRIVLVGLAIFLSLLAMMAMINAWSGGAIEEIVRWYFLKERLSASGQTVYADISGGRLAIWRAALDSWTQRPFIGYGLGAELEAYSRGWVTKVQFHSYLIQTLHNTGLIGILLITAGWSVWLIRSLKKVFLVRDVDEKIVLGSMLVYVFGVFFFGLYGHSLSFPPSTQFFWLCVGFLCVLPRPRKSGIQI